MFFGDKKKAGEASPPPGDSTARPVAGHVPVQRIDGVPYLDLRAELPPTPFVAVIELIERPDTGDVVIASFPRDPEHLYPELVERGWNWERVASTPPEKARLRLTRTG